MPFFVSKKKYDNLQQAYTNLEQLHLRSISEQALKQSAEYTRLKVYEQVVNVRDVSAGNIERYLEKAYQFVKEGTYPQT